MLDKLGYAKKDGQGFRLRPDGQKVFFAIDVIPTLYPDAVDTLELVKRHWAEHRRRHEGQHDRTRALLHARRQQRS